MFFTWEVKVKNLCQEKLCDQREYSSLMACHFKKISDIQETILFVTMSSVSLRHFLLLLPQFWSKMVGKYHGSTNTYFFFKQSVCDHLISREKSSFMRVSVSAYTCLRARMLRAIFLVKMLNSRWVNQNNFILLFRSAERYSEQNSIPILLLINKSINQF